jgi:predicted nucleotidyltransferase
MNQEEPFGRRWEEPDFFTQSPPPEPSPADPGAAEPSLGRALWEKLNRWCDRVAAVLPDDLIAVSVFGGAVRGDHHPDTSVVSLLVVLRRVELDLLEALAVLADEHNHDLRLALTVATEEDLRRSTDVFPARLHKMQHAHVVLRGEDVLANLPISAEHLRLDCERTVKQLLVELRQCYLQRPLKPEGLGALLTGTIIAFLNSLSFLVELETGRWPSAPPAVINSADSLGLDARVLHDVYTLRFGGLQPDLAGLKRLFASYMVNVEKAAARLDRLKSGGFSAGPSPSPARLPGVETAGTEDLPPPQEAAAEDVGLG